MDADEFIINVVAKKSNGIIELSVPDDVFNQAERILLKNEQGVFCKTFPAEAFGSDSWISTKDELPEMTEEVTEVNGDREYTLWYESKPVLVFDKTIYDETGRKQTAVLTDDSSWLTTFDEKRLENVTHWMPLPDDPQEN